MKGAGGLTLVTLLLLGSATAEPYLQVGADAQRTGATADAGPTPGAVAFVVDVGRFGTTVAATAPLILDGAVFVTTGPDASGPSELVRVDLRNASKRTIATLDSVESGLASDGERLFASQLADVIALALDGSPLWSSPHPALVAGPAITTCEAPAVDRGVVYYACIQSTNRATVTFARALDAVTGEERWVWTMPPASSVPGGTPWPETTPLARVLPPSVLGDLVVLMRPGLPATLFAVDLEGTLAWTSNDADFTPLDLWDLATGSRDAPQNLLPGDASRAIVFYGTMVCVYDLRDGTLVDRIRFSNSEDPFLTNTRNVALLEETVLGTVGTSLVIADLATSQVQVVESQERWGRDESLVVASGVLYGTHGVLEGATTLEQILLTAVDAATGAPLWSMMLGGGANSYTISVGDGVLAALHDTGELWVVGTTPASIPVSVSLPTEYPALDETFAIEVESVGEGAFGPAEEYRADWGDGSFTDWQPSPVMTHRYEDAGDVEARFSARNSAGQVSVALATLHPGGGPPVAKLATAEQIGLLTSGLVLLVGVGASGAYGLHVARRRRFVRGELSAIEADHTSTRGSPESWTAAVESRRGRWASLLEEGRLRAEDILLLERRVESLARARGGGDPARATEIATGVALRDRYQVRQMLGEGGQARVFLAWDDVLSREVVLKVVPHGADGGRALLHEARTIAALDHPNVVRVLDTFTERGSVVLVMELLPGGTLRARLAREGRLPRREALRIMREILAGLQAAHAIGVVHRDLKPENVLFTRDGTAKVIDFGIARPQGPYATLATSAPAGTHQYMSPEQFRGGRADTRSDVYSAGALLHEMLEGRHVFPAPSADPVMFLLRDAELAHVETESLRTVLARALARDPSKRYATAGEMADALAGLDE